MLLVSAGAAAVAVAVAAAAARCRRMCRTDCHRHPAMPGVPLVPLTVTLAARIAVGINSITSSEETRARTQRSRAWMSARWTPRVRGEMNYEQHDSPPARTSCHPSGSGTFESKAEEPPLPLPAGTTCSSSDPGFCITPNVRPLKVGATIESKRR